VCNTAPSWSTIMMTAKQFEKTGSVINLQAVKMPKYPRKSHVRKTFTFDKAKASKIAKISCST
jgi:hypothetical protein